jgi:hypothetical protein
MTKARGEVPRRRRGLATIGLVTVLAGCRAADHPVMTDASPGPASATAETAPPDADGLAGASPSPSPSPAPDPADAEPAAPDESVPAASADALAPEPDPADATAPPDGATATPGAAPGCSDLFRQDVVPTYSIEISDDEWTKMVAEFNNLTALRAGLDFAVYHPVVFHFGDETVTTAAIKLRGQSSWGDAVSMDGARAKMQFNVSFKELNSGGKFHGLSKLTFDMPRSDWSFLHDRLAHNWLRQIGIMAGCSNSARLIINGAFYGLYVAEEPVGHPLVRQFFPQHPDGDLWKAGEEAETNESTANWDRLHVFQQASDIGSLGAIVDIPGSVNSWAAEALLNDADGMYGGFHNFYIYDQGAAGFVYLPQDTDATFDWLAVFDPPAGIQDHPIFWWETRTPPVLPPAAQWLIVMNDPTARQRYLDAMANLLTKWDQTQLLGWIDTWSNQIASDVALDPHTWATPADFSQAVTLARQVVQQRPAFLQSFVDCARGGPGADADGDGFKWCDDCRDQDPAVHPGAAEICGNAIDDNCNGIADDGCPGGPPLGPTPFVPPVGPPTVR